MPLRDWVFVGGALSTLASAAFAGCSSGPPPVTVPDTSGLDPDGGLDAGRPLTDLTLSERKKLCDWAAGIAGGYGKFTVCDGGAIVSNHQDQAECLAEYLGSCFTVTVKQFEACQKKQAADPCALAFETAVECAPLRACLGKTEGGPPPERDGGTD
jgi:hypothetical protein